MKDGRKKQEIDFASKRRSLLHTYDNFVTAQTRIFTLANYVYSNVGGEVESRQEQLFLDDFLNFGISARRLIELSGVKSFANHVSIKERRFNSRELPTDTLPVDTKIGFLAFVNFIVHAKYIQLIRSRMDLFPYQRGAGQAKDAWALYQLYEKTDRENRWKDFAVDVSVIVISDTNKLSIVALSDLIAASSEVLDRIISKCDQVGIHLEMDMRRLD